MNNLKLIYPRNVYAPFGKYIHVKGLLGRGGEHLRLIHGKGVDISRWTIPFHKNGLTRVCVFQRSDVRFGHRGGIWIV